MRQVKFRGRLIDSKEWLHGPLLKQSYRGDARWYIGYVRNGSIQGREIDPETVGQYIERKDRCSCEIFEGDIVTDDEQPDEVGVVVYDERKSMFGLKFSEGIIYGLYDCKNKEIEVIGNIHDNPELLKQTENNETAKKLKTT